MFLRRKQKMTVYRSETWTDLKRRLLLERSGLCEWCLHNKIRKPAHQLHHALIGRMKGKPELDVEENAMLVCSECHYTGRVEAREVAEWFWERQCVRYGEEHMREWLDGLPLKVKPRYGGE